GYDITASGATLDRFCGSGITSANYGAHAVMAGMEDLVVTGGTEMMSLPKKGLLPMGANNLHLQAIHPQSHQGVCADAIASQEGIPREALDALAAESQRRAAVAIAEGRFDKSLIPVLDLDGTVALDHEEFPRPQTTVESLAQLAPSFPAVADYRHTEDSLTFRELINQKYPDLVIEHVHHAGNSSGVVDGAAALLMASEEYAKANGLMPRARVVATANMGDDPTLMLNAPVPSARKVLAKAGMTLDDVDLVDMHEAFAAQVLAVIKMIGSKAFAKERLGRDEAVGDVDMEQLNLHGGSVAIGHPFGATGARMVTTVANELARGDKETALLGICAAGGLGAGAVMERVS
ncbi:MAG: acetyl-CoA C-acyltransferase, partial [Acidimicrobiales bacterium]|nr:acetyl-CoA C-acyltransferase [Acidimicrobiales bacterium]